MNLRLLMTLHYLSGMICPYGRCLVPVYSGNRHLARSGSTLLNQLKRKISTKRSPSSLTQVQGSKMKFTKFIKSAAIIAAASLAMANTALAQSTILVVDQARVIRDSSVGQHVRRQIESIATQMQAEIKAQNSPLESELARLQADTKGMTGEALQSRPDPERIQ